MVLDARLRKLAQGVSAKEAAQAYARSLGGETLEPAQQARADEFLAIVEAMFLMAAVDGDVAQDEVERLAASIQALGDMHVTHMNVQAKLEELNELLSKEGWHKRIDAVAARLPSEESRAFAFRMAAGVAFVDDHVAHAEAAAIDALAAKLQLSSEDTNEILREVHEELFG
ncbi:MAG: TerB family tellurite resistance protein [Myxococcales bacterium]|nr:TerB family tellurite resistance protein [Myxococcales bacterium]